MLGRFFDTSDVLYHKNSVGNKLTEISIPSNSRFNLETSFKQ